MTVSFVKAGAAKVKVLRAVNKIPICTFHVYYPIRMALGTRDLHVCSLACVGTVTIGTGTVKNGAAKTAVSLRTYKNYIHSSTLKIHDF